LINARVVNNSVPDLFPAASLVKNRYIQRRDEERRSLG
jgi:hypothetical protein